MEFHCNEKSTSALWVNDHSGWKSCHVCDQKARERQTLILICFCQVKKIKVINTVIYKYISNRKVLFVIDMRWISTPLTCHADMLFVCNWDWRRSTQFVSLKKDGKVKGKKVNQERTATPSSINRRVPEIDC